MASIKQLVYRTWSLLEGTTEISSESRFTYRSIKAAVKSAVAIAMRDSKFVSSNIEDSNKYASEVFTQFYEGITILTDPVTDLKYIDLPCELMPIHDGRQVSIYPESGFNYNTSAIFVPVSKQEQFINRFQTALPDVTMFYISGKSRVTFTQQGRVLAEEKVNAAVKFSIPLDDDRDLGAGEDDLNKIVTTAYQTLAPEVKPIDQSIDGVPNP